MADRGFKKRDTLTKKEVYLKIPPFSKKGKIFLRPHKLGASQAELATDC